MEQNKDSTDRSSIKPVSSLLSHFENLQHPNESDSRSPTSAGRPSGPTFHSRHERFEEPFPRRDGRSSLDIPRRTEDQVNHPEWARSIHVSTGAPTSNLNVSTPKARPVSIGPFSQSQAPPLVNIISPRSPARSVDNQKQLKGTNNDTFNLTGEKASSSYIRDRPSTPSLDPAGKSAVPGPVSSKLDGDPQKKSDYGQIPGHKAQGLILNTPPPPVNRAGKPKNFEKRSSSLGPSGSTTLAPTSAHELPEDRVSPFSTPPSSGSSENGRDSPPLNGKGSTSIISGPRNYGDGFKKEIHVTHEENRGASKWDVPSSPSISGATRSVRSRTEVESDLPLHRPGLPPRRETTLQEPKSSSSAPVTTNLSRLSQSVRPSESSPGNSIKFPPPPKRSQPSGFGGQHAQLELPARSLSRASSESRRSSPRAANGASNAEDSDDERRAPAIAGPTMTDYPDATHTNRRPPRLRQRPWEINTKYDTKLFAICGEHVCTTGYITRVWSLVTGELIVDLNHPDTTKVTAISFKAGRNLEDEGKRIWLGTNLGEIYELDIPSRAVVQTKTNAHSRREIIKIYRHGYEMWSLDEDGKLQLWIGDSKGGLDLSYTPHSLRLPKGHSFSIVAGNKLWHAVGKEIRVFQPTMSSNVDFQVLHGSLSQPGVGEVTSGAVIASQSDRIYFGHADGKITIYSRVDYSCLRVVNVSLYKISSLVGVADFLWAGYNTGMIYVYDTKSQPWKVLKDWKAHENPIAGIVVDPTSVWKMDRLQVASLSTDNLVCLWDGVLREDWLESAMQERITEYCAFRDVSALVLTWNAGASKPTYLNNDEQDASFFRNLLHAQEPPDILVFGFQELVDLEDKKVTAMSFFKSSKRKDPTKHEHISHQYRAWRDHLSFCLSKYMDANTDYTLLHSANLVGLFTCIFVKSSERRNVKDLHAAEVKCGLGGLHGNKGAIIIRFILDDSSLCFVNCHLAAGQEHTVHRNNDIANILETEALPLQTDPVRRVDWFVSGGDGSMILDHDICILNGDLNYRIDVMARDSVIRAVKENNLARLLERDQLLTSRRKNPGFRLRAFNEHTINFAPTYKYDVGTDNYDSSDKKRSPAWCDRILYRGQRVRQLDYRRHEVRVSDHRPVSARFQIGLKTILPDKQERTLESCERRFEAEKRRIAMEIKLDYFMNVLGLSRKDVESLL